MDGWELFDDAARSDLQPIRSILGAPRGIDGAGDAERYGLWRPSFALDHRAEEPPMACFTLGMCCHINFDLACSLDETIRELGYANDPLALEEIERGHNFVDTILADKTEHSTELLAAEMDCPMSKKILASGAVKT